MLVPKFLSRKPQKTPPPFPNGAIPSIIPSPIRRAPFPLASRGYRFRIGLAALNDRGRAKLFSCKPQKPESTRISQWYNVCFAISVYHHPSAVCCRIPSCSYVASCAFLGVSYVSVSAFIMIIFQVSCIAWNRAVPSNSQRFVNHFLVAQQRYGEVNVAGVADTCEIMSWVFWSLHSTVSCLGAMMISLWFLL